MLLIVILLVLVQYESSFLHVGRGRHSSTIVKLLPGLHHAYIKHTNMSETNTELHATRFIIQEKDLQRVFFDLIIRHKFYLVSFYSFSFTLC